VGGKGLWVGRGPLLSGILLFKKPIEMRGVGRNGEGEVVFEGGRKWEY